MSELKINDLSVADWVSCDGVVGTVTYINLSDSIGFLTKNLRWWVVRITQIQPIPLTPEILEKNGVTLAEDYDENGGLFTCPEFSVVRYGDGYTFEVPQARVRVEHVHELQHAMRLAGVKKELIL